MKTKRIPILLAWLMFFSIPAWTQQAVECARNRYIDEVFPVISQTGFNVQYGAIPYLNMNIYEPNGDNATQRPLVIFAHGGGFTWGAKTNDRMVYLCKEFAKRGYVAASINYRLHSEEITDDSTFITATVRAVQDMKAAVKFFIDDPEAYRIDVNFVFVGGFSAGAFTALHLAYWNEGDINVADSEEARMLEIIQTEGGLEVYSDESVEISSYISGVINHSGGIFRKDWINKGEPPIVSRHGENDPAVPIDSGYVRISVVDIIFQYGSESIHQYASGQNISNYLDAVSGGEHTDIYDTLSADYNAYLDNTFAFFKENVLCNSPFPVEWLSFEAKYERQGAVLDWSTGSEINSYYFEVQRSVNGVDYSPIGKVNATGNSSAVVNYEYIDEGVYLLSRSKLYYRLRQVDLDNQWSYSNTVELNIPASEASLKVYPNPTSGLLFIQNIQPTGKNIEVALIDTRGKLIRTGSLAPNQKLEWSMEMLASGVYYLRVRQGQRISLHKVIKK